MPRISVTVDTPVHDCFRVQQVIGMFGLPEQPHARETFTAEIPGLDEDWQIGCIVGPSGSGKTTLARAAFRSALYVPAPWPSDRAVIDSLGDRPLRQIAHVLTAVGLGSPPTWLRPFPVLSNGEKFRCELARALLAGDELVVFDEYTSLVDRTVAKIASAAIGRSIRKGRINCRFVGVTCHGDVAEWLEPDWVLDLGCPDPAIQLQRRRLRRPALRLAVRRCPQRLWRVFARHHYLSGGLSTGATCFAAWHEDRPVAFCALVAILGHRGQKRISRLVTLPDYQGLGIGLRLAERVAEFGRSQGWRISITASHPAIIAACSRSALWQLRAWKPLGYLWKQHFGRRAIPGSAGRGVATFEYRGPLETAPHDDRKEPR
jgi:GNAT superfamily N-acetyltransferase